MFDSSLGGAGASFVRMATASLRSLLAARSALWASSMSGKPMDSRNERFSSSSIPLGVLLGVGSRTFQVMHKILVDVFLKWNLKKWLFLFVSHSVSHKIKQFLARLVFAASILEHFVPDFVFTNHQWF